MVLLPSEIVKNVPKLYETENERLEDKMARVKLFLPATAWTWYVMEYDGNDTCFGYVDSGTDGSEYGYFSLKELSELRTSSGFRVERDIFFKPKTLDRLQLQ